MPRWVEIAINVGSMDDRSKLRVIVTGTGGRLGPAVARRLRDEHRVLSFDRKAMDLTRPEVIADHLQAVRFDVIIHCAAVTSLEYCEAHPEEAQAVNVAAPRQMAELCRDAGARMIYVSTDYVYDGTRAGLRQEDDPLAPTSVYAATKLAGEEAVREVLEDSIIARTSWVFGPDRPGFVDQTIRRALQGDADEAIADKYSSPTYSLDVAESMAALLLRPEIRGLLNVCNAGNCSWHELGTAALQDAAAMGLPLRRETLPESRLVDVKAFVAERPIYTAMDTAKLASLLGSAPRPWREALRDYLRTYFLPA
jgi:dTDP-4-dehydrorhamnose reductase